MLERHGYRTVEAGPVHALDLKRMCPAEVGLVITNAPSVFLPYSEKVRLVYIAACPDYTLASQFRTCRVLHKPFHPSELLEAVKELAGSL